MKHVTNRVQNELDSASTQVDALCELLAAAQDRPVAASSIHALLQPLARRLNSAAGQLSDQLERCAD